MRWSVLAASLSCLCLSSLPAQHPIGPVRLSPIASDQIVALWDRNAAPDSLACLYGRVDGDSLIVVDSAPRFEPYCRPEIQGPTVIGALGFLHDGTIGEDTAIDHMRIVMAHRRDWFIAAEMWSTLGVAGGPDGTGAPTRLPQLWASWRLHRFVVPSPYSQQR